MPRLLEPDEIDRELKELHGWRARGGFIIKAFDFEQFMESLGRAFQSNAREAAVGEDHAGEDLAADLETEIIAPRHVLGSSGNERQSLRIQSTSGMGKMIARGVCWWRAGRSRPAALFPKGGWGRPSLHLLAHPTAGGPLISVALL